MNVDYPKTTKIYGDSSEYTLDEPQSFILIPTDIYGDIIHINDILYDTCDYNMVNPFRCTGYASYIDKTYDGEYGWQLCFIDEGGNTHFGDECVKLSEAHRFFNSQHND